MEQSQECTLRMLAKQVVHLYMKRMADLQQKSGLNPGGGRCGILFVLRQQDGQSQKDLAHKLGVKPPSITAALKKLEADGYITRQQDGKDQRITRIYVTDAGRQQADKAIVIMHQVDQKIFAGVSAEQKQQFHKVLLQMKENLAEQEGIEDTE